MKRILKKLGLFVLISMFLIANVNVLRSQTVGIPVELQDVKLQVVYPKNNQEIEELAPELKVNLSKPLPQGYVAFYVFRIQDEETKNVVYYGKNRNPYINVSYGKLEKGKTYLWVAGVAIYDLRTGKPVKGKNDSILFTSTGVKKFSVCSSQEKKEEVEVSFEKKGNTFIAAIEFSDRKLPSDWERIAKEKMEAIINYYKIISYNSSDLDELTYDIYPEKIVINGRMADYAADVKDDEFGEWLIDAGNTGESWGGRLKFMENVVRELFVRRGIPLNRYHHLIYFTPGKYGAKEGSDEFWPASSGINPASIYYDASTDTLRNYPSGILQGLNVPEGILAHEFGHQFGLPDLYPYPSIPGRDLSFSALMASGGANFVCMTMLCRMKDYHKTRLKGNWCKGKYEIVKLSKGEKKSYTLWARDSKGDKLTLFVKIPQKTGYYMVSVFDRRGVDKRIKAYLFKKYISYKTGTASYLNRETSNDDSFNSLVSKAKDLLSKDKKREAYKLLQKSKSGRIYKARAGVLISYVNSTDVAKVKMAYLEPRNFFYTSRFFLNGGRLDNGDGVIIRVKKVYPREGRFVADIEVERK